MISAMFSEALSALAANRLRTALTMLGMIIGVAAVIVMLAVGAGAQDRVNQSIASLGSNLLIVLSGSAQAGGVRLGSGQAPTLTSEDAEAIASLPSVRAAAPMMPGGAQVMYGAQNWGTQIFGVTPDFFTVRDWRLASGEPFTEADVRQSTRNAILGQSVADQLFGGEDPLGKTIRIRNAPFIVTGVLTRKGQSLDGRDQDDTILIPLTTAQRQLFGGQFRSAVRTIMVQARSEELMRRAEAEVTALLRERHRIQPGQEDDFTVRDLTAVTDQAAAAAMAMSLMLGAIAGVSLLVGGIGIMNIMLVSVTERTREIGIRMAIGARRRDVLWQFLLEALLISLAGCLIGVLLGVGGAILTERLSGAAAIVSAESVAAAFAMAAAVGVFFGFYPARKAARLSPIEALRYQ